MNAQPDLAYIQSAVLQLIHQYNYGFLNFGDRMFQIFAVLLIVREGILTMFVSIDVYRFAVTMARICFIFFITQYYSIPAPGIGFPVSDVIPQTMQFLFHTLDVTAIDQANDHITLLWNKFDAPDYFNAIPLILYCIATVLVFIAKCLLIVILGYSLISATIVLIVGPILIPFFLIPSYAFLFWGWMKLSIEFGLIPIIGMLWIIVMDTAMYGFITQMPAHVTTTQFGVWIFSAGAILLTLIYGLWQVPSLAAKFVSGGSSPGGFATALSSKFNSRLFG